MLHTECIQKYFILRVYVAKILSFYSHERNHKYVTMGEEVSVPHTLQYTTYYQTSSNQIAEFESVL